MCVIAVKKAGVNMPSEQRIKEMWDRNKDGAGYMYYDHKEKSVRISKGYMHYDDFKKALDDLGKLHKLKNVPVILHFRITTHGGTTAANTHPFPVTSNVGHLKALDLWTNLGVAHNGVINSVADEKDLSDTQIYIRDVLTAFRGHSGDNFLHTHKKVIDSTIGASKLAFLDDSGVITTFGNFSETKDKDGLLYSNTYFEPYTPPKTTYPYGGYGGKKYETDYSVDRYTKNFTKDMLYFVNDLVPFYKQTELDIDDNDILFAIDTKKDYFQDTIKYASSIIGNKFYNLTTGKIVKNVEMIYLTKPVLTEDKKYTTWCLANSFMSHMITEDVLKTNDLLPSMVKAIMDNAEEFSEDDNPIAASISDLFLNTAIAYEDLRAKPSKSSPSTKDKTKGEIEIVDKVTKAIECHECGTAPTDNNIGGVKNTETQHILMNANRSVLSKKEFNKFRLQRVKRGALLVHDRDYINKVVEAGIVNNPKYDYVKNTLGTHLLKNTVVETDDWYYSSDVKGFVYKAKNGDFLGVFELLTPTKEGLKTILEPAIRVYSNITLYYEDTGL